jgi:hypothetical protein
LIMARFTTSAAVPWITVFTACFEKKGKTNKTNQQIWYWYGSYLHTKDMKKILNKVKD